MGARVSCWMWKILFPQPTTKTDLFKSIGYVSVACVREREKSDTWQGPPARFYTKVIKMLK